MYIHVYIHYLKCCIKVPKKQKTNFIKKKESPYVIHDLNKAVIFTALVIVDAINYM